MYHPDELNSTLLSQVFVLENVSHNRKSGQDIHSKDKGGGKEPLIAQIQLVGQPVVTPLNDLLQPAYFPMFSSLTVCLTHGPPAN